eukprot:gene62079-84900_t
MARTARQRSRLRRDAAILSHPADNRASATQLILTAALSFCLRVHQKCVDADSPAMMVCSCNVITDRDIREVIISLLDEDCWQLIVPGKVYHAMQKRGRCCGCFPNVVDIIVRTTEDYHLRRQPEGDEVVDFIARLR